MSFNVISDADVICSIGMGGIVGAIGAKVSGIISQKIRRLNPLQLVSTIIPQYAKKTLKTGLFTRILGQCNEKIGGLFGGGKCKSTIGAPIVEEVVFRSGIQQGLTLCFSYGMPREAAAAASIFLTNILFSMAHGRELESTEGTELWLKGAAYSLAYIQGGLLSAIAAHAINNIRHFMPSVSELFDSSEPSSSKSLSEILAMNKALARQKNESLSSQKTAEKTEDPPPKTVEDPSPKTVEGPSQNTVEDLSQKTGEASPKTEDSIPES